MILSFTVPGRPVSWARPNVVLVRDKRGRMRPRPLTDKDQRDEKGRIAMLARAALPRGWPRDRTYAVEVIGYYPDRRFGDSDRAVGLILDALEGVAYATDRQVGAHVHARKIDPKRPRVEVIVVPYDEDDDVTITIAIGGSGVD